MRGDDLTVSEAAEVLGTSPQTVRTLLRKGQLRGERHPWGSRFVWKISNDGLEEFLSEYGRLDGHRRPRVREPAAPEHVVPPAAPLVDRPSADEPTLTLPAAPPVPPELGAGTEEEAAETRLKQRPFVLRPRGRATVVVLVLGVPLLLVYATARTIPDVLWYDELGQRGVFARLVLAKTEFRVLVAGTVAVFVWLNLLVAGRDTWLVRRRGPVLALGALALVIGGLFASATAGHWQTYLLWRHRQSFGVVDPVHGKDVGFFVFTLPFEVLLAGMLVWLAAVTFGCVVAVHAVRGTVGVRPLRTTFAARVHLSALAAAFLLAVAWRLWLERYLLELQQPGLVSGRSFAGAGYVDVHVRTPALAALALTAVLLALVCAATPVIRRGRDVRLPRRTLAVTGVVLGGLVLLGVGLVPALVQRYVVDPSPVAVEAPYLTRSAEATRQALGLDRIDVEPYDPSGRVTPADFGPVERRLSHVTTWDTSLLGSRMKELVTDTPYFSPETPSLDVVPVDGRQQPTVVSARELDLGSVDQGADTWDSQRLAYTHGLGLVRFSGTDVGPDREPRLLDSGLGLRQPRIYFGDFRGSAAEADDEGGSPALTPTLVPGLADSSWVLADTRRPEVDVAAAHASPRSAYHYQGRGGIELSSWTRRALFALALGSKQLLLSDDLTPSSRILLHRDVHDRLHTLAPFIRWDNSAVPLTKDGRILFVVDGYTTSADYPFSQRVDLGGSSVGYARASVRATVDAYSGETTLYLTGPRDPIARAWAEAFPTLFQPAGRMPADLRARVRYPADLFDAQATAYERFHTESPDILASGSDAWSRPTALSGPLEVAGGVDFDESDEDDLRLALTPAYSYAVPPGRAGPRLVLTTYYTPRRGQNLVATLAGWVDQLGRPHLVSRSLPRDPVVLGPAQVSRLVFATPRVRNLLGLRNLEIRDLETSSLDSVILGRPHVLFTDGGLVQVQSLYEGSRGPGAARLLGVTVFVNGRAGLGPDMVSALRQALNAPPEVAVRRPHGPVTVGEQVRVAFRVSNAQREIVTITSGDDRTRKRLALAQGREVVSFVPSAAGRAHVHVQVVGLDGTRVSDGTGFPVFSRPPAIKILHAPNRPVVGRTVRIRFQVTRGQHALARVSTRSGIVLARRYLLRHHVGVLQWTPEARGPAVVLLRARGRQGQTVSTSLRLHVRARPAAVPPTIALVTVPDDLTTGLPAPFVLQADGCRVAVVRIRGPVDDVPVFRFPCPVGRGTFSWTPGAPGTYHLTAVARGPQGLDASQRLRLEVAPSPTASPSPSPSAGRSSSPPRRDAPRPARRTGVR